MSSVQFGDFSAALSFLREIKAGMVKRNPRGQGYQWSSDNEDLDGYQLSFLKAYCGIESTWTDTETGLTWLLETTYFAKFSYSKGEFNFAGHNDWRAPTITELKTLRAPIKDEHGAFVKPPLSGRLMGAYACCTPVRRGCRDDGMVWNFTSNKSSEVQYREGKIQWGAEGEYAGFEKDRISGEGALIYVRGCRTDKLSEWAETLVRWADENEYHDFPVTTETILALETLGLEDGKFPEHLSKLENLRKVNLYQCKTAPQELITLKNLEELNWKNDFFDDETDGDICDLPDELGKLSRLTSLVVQDVGIKTLPSSIGKLLNLKILHIKNTQLDTLPDTIGGLESLEEVILTFNNLTVLPSSITALKSLRHLTIRERGIEELPNELGCLTTLETIDFDSTPLHYLPDNFVNLKKLTKLSIQWSKLTAIPDWLTEINSLQSLNVSFNRINSLPLNIGQMRQLESLRFIGTLISELPESLKQLDKLRVLGMSGTPLLAIPDWIGGMKNLTNINAACMWYIKKLPQFEGKNLSSFLGTLDQPYGRAWLESIGWPGK